MVNFGDPAVILQDIAILSKLWHAVNGLYIWEFVTTLGYELDVIRGRRPYRWTIWIYSLTRVSTLLAIVLSFINLDVTSHINCQVWFTFQLIFSYSVVVIASLLIVLRITAIWNKDKIVVTISAGIWFVNAVVVIQGKSRHLPSHRRPAISRGHYIYQGLCGSVININLIEFRHSKLIYLQARAAWVPSRSSCIAINTEENKLNLIVGPVLDTVLLLTMLAGLLRLRRGGDGRFGVIRFLWNQGVLWILLATIIGVPPMVMIVLNLNAPLNLMLQLPAAIAHSIAVTRMYRSLTNFVSGSTYLTFEDVMVEDVMVYDSKAARAIPPRQNEVSVDTTSGQFPMSEDSESSRSMDGPGQLGDKPHGLNLEQDLESAVGSIEMV
ncbi:hypothetical protein BC827DRAFT_1374775 [Russula dissimulans]|nr:hypothetical protein BC827DRAFT_1374775 [Russula dissimulans]